MILWHELEKIHFLFAIATQDLLLDSECCAYVNQLVFAITRIHINISTPLENSDICPGNVSLPSNKTGIHYITFLAQIVSLSERRRGAHHLGCFDQMDLGSE